jgi:hypothetical protein
MTTPGTNLTAADTTHQAENDAPAESKGSNSNLAVPATELDQSNPTSSATAGPSPLIKAPGSVPSAGVESNGQPSANDSSEPAKKKHPLTWDRTIEIAKLLATIWVAFVGSYVTMQFNERQHELNRIEAIAKMLPHISSKDSTSTDDSDGEDSTQAGPTVAVPIHVAKGKRVTAAKAGAGSDSLKTQTVGTNSDAAIGVGSPIQTSVLGDHDMSRDGAIWAIFRTANNRVMLRDLAALFPQDIYRVVGSIAIAGELEHDKDAMVALQVASEKLATKYSADPRHAELASRLYAQALRLKERKPDDDSPLHIIDLTTDIIEAPTSDEHVAHLVHAVNDLADMHMKDGEGPSKKLNAGHWQAKDLYKRARMIGTGSKDVQVQLQVVRADLGLSKIYLNERVLGDALQYLKEAHKLEHQITPKPDTRDPLKALDANNDGFATEEEIRLALEDARSELIVLLEQNRPKGVSIN